MSASQSVYQRKDAEDGCRAWAGVQDKLHKRRQLSNNHNKTNWLRFEEGLGCGKLSATKGAACSRLSHCLS